MWFHYECVCDQSEHCPSESAAFKIKQFIDKLKQIIAVELSQRSHYDAREPRTWLDLHHWNIHAQYIYLVCD